MAVSTHDVHGYLVIAFVLLSTPFMRLEAESACTTLTTFNTALLPRITGYDERRKLVPGALVGENADVLCLQEVWFEQDVQRLISSTKDFYPYHFSLLHKGGQEPPAREHHFTDTACSASDSYYFYSRIFPCAVINGCYQQFQEGFQFGLSCAATRCRRYFQSEKIRPQCITCLTLTATSITNLLGRCTSEFHGRDNRLNDAGLVLLSKKRPTSVNQTSFFPGKDMTLPRAYIQAEFEDMPPVLCTHLTSLFSVSFEYDIPFDTYKAQQQEEIRQLGAVYGKAPHYILGDMNVGAAGQPYAVGERAVEGEGVEQYEMLMNMGYRSPYIEQDGRCTYCKANPNSNGINNNAIDHFLIMGNTAATITSKRVLDSAPNGMTLSDHYGVRTTICDNPVN